MANDKVSKNRSNKLVTVIVTIAVLILSYLGVDFSGILEPTTNPNEGNVGNQIVTDVEGTMQVHFIDVGNADSTLIVQGDEAILIDAGTKSRGDDVVEYIKSLGIKKLKAFILTHPHDDHMGGSSYVLDNVEIDVVYGPDIFDIKELYTKGWYKSMVASVENIDAKRNEGKPEDEWTSVWNFPRTPGDNDFVTLKVGQAVVQFIAPNSDEYSDMNDYSVVSRVTFGTVDVLIMGDATKLSEKEILNAGWTVDAEVYRIGHHGSVTSTGKEFIDAVNPEYVVISCGLGNKHKHPDEEVVSMLEEMQLPLYRTDESGTIVMTTDGENIEFDKSPGTYENGEEKGE